MWFSSNKQVPEWLDKLFKKVEKITKRKVILKYDYEKRTKQHHCVCVSNQNIYIRHNIYNKWADMLVLMVYTRLILNATEKEHHLPNLGLGNNKKNLSESLLIYNEEVYIKFKGFIENELSPELKEYAEYINGLR